MFENADLAKLKYVSIVYVHIHMIFGSGRCICELLGGISYFIQCTALQFLPLSIISYEWLCCIEQRWNINKQWELIIFIL